MCSSANCNPANPEFPPWLYSGLKLAWRHRTTVGQIIGLAAVALVVVGLYWFRFSPTDLERADADIKKARVLILSLEEEALQQLENARKYKKQLAQVRKSLDEEETLPDPAWREWCEAMADGNTRLYKAHYARRDNLLRLIVHDLRLLTEAECEFLRAKDARDRGTPYPVSPRVQELLAPVFASR